MILRQKTDRLPLREFIALMASMMALVALSIDAVLPALDKIEESLLLSGGNYSHLIVSILFLGLAIGQVFFGTLSDFIGRKPAVMIGMIIFIMGCIISFLSTNTTVMLIGRLLQGIGLSGPRVICVALVRDQYKGAEMARIMSLIMSIFIIMPAIAPLLGQSVLFLFSWHYIFVLSMLVGLIVLLWFMIRQPETLTIEEKKTFSFLFLFHTILSILRNKNP